MWAYTKFVQGSTYPFISRVNPTIYFLVLKTPTYFPSKDQSRFEKTRFVKTYFDIYLLEQSCQTKTNYRGNILICQYLLNAGREERRRNKLLSHSSIEILTRRPFVFSVDCRILTARQVLFTVSWTFGRIQN